MLECKTTHLKATPTFTDKEGNVIMFEPVRQANGTYLLVGCKDTEKRNADLESEVQGQQSTQYETCRDNKGRLIRTCRSLPR